MLKANYLVRRCIVDIYNESGYAGARYVAYGTEFRVPDTFIDNINSSKENELIGWDIDGDGKADIAPDEKDNRQWRYEAEACDEAKAVHGNGKTCGLYRKKV